MKECDNISVTESGISLLEYIINLRSFFLIAKFIHAHAAQNDTVFSAADCSVCRLSKSAAHDKDSSRKKSIRNIFILLPGCRRPHAVAPLSQYLFSILSPVAETRFTVKRPKRVRERTKQDREMTRYRETPVELFSPVESGVTAAVPRMAPRAECGKFKAGYIFRARPSPLGATTAANVLAVKPFGSKSKSDSCLGVTSTRLRLP